MSDSRPVNIVFMTDKEEDFAQLSDLLNEFDFHLDSQYTTDLEWLDNYHKEHACELLVFWHQHNNVNEKELSTFIKTSTDPPAVIFVTEKLENHDYIHAAALGAHDVISLETRTQFPFVVQREVSHIRMRRKLDEMRQKIEADYIVADEELEVPADVGPMDSLVTTIDDALKNDGFELLFQPIMAVPDDGCDNYEVFLRIKTNKDTYVTPGEFMPVAEQYGLMPAIDRWVVKNAIKRFKAEQDVRRITGKGDRKLRFYLNISGHSLGDEVIMGNIIVEIVQAKLPAGSLVVEVDKNTVLSRLQKTKALNQNIKKLKLEFAIDHYEESDNSLNYIKHLDFDYMKLNKGLLESLHADDKKRVSVRNIIEKARKHEIKVIASQVENAAVLSVLYDLGVDYIQGYVIAEPTTRLQRAVMDETLDQQAS